MLRFAVRVLIAGFEPLVNEIQCSLVWNLCQNTIARADGVRIIYQLLLLVTRRDQSVLGVQILTFIRSKAN